MTTTHDFLNKDQKYEQTNFTILRFCTQRFEGTQSQHVVIKSTVRGQKLHGVVGLPTALTVLLGQIDFSCLIALQFMVLFKL